MYKRCIVMVADGGRADLMQQLLENGRLPNIREHITDRGCYRTALTVFPSTTGPAHIPFVSGIHPGTANVPGYRWLSRKTHDTRRRSMLRHRSLNTPRGMFLGRDMDPEKSSSLYEYFDNPSTVLDPVDYCPDGRLHRIIWRRLFYVVRAHKTDDWGPIDRMIESNIIKRICAGSECIVATFFGIDEYSHLYDPFDERTIGAYENIDRAVGNIAKTLKENDVYDQTILTIVSDHGLTATTTHIPVVDILKQHDFKPFYYPKLYRRSCDSAVMESGNSMAQIYFKRGENWGQHWNWDELAADQKIKGLLDTLVHTRGMSFAAARRNGGGVTVVGREGRLDALDVDGCYEISIDGVSPLPDHPVGRFEKRELFERTFDHTYPDAVNQLTLLFSSERSGDLALSSDPTYDLRLQHEDPEHHGSHGSLHREHMHVPLAFSVPFKDKYVYNYDVVPTILALTGKNPTRPFDGRRLNVNGYYPTESPSTRDDAAEPGKAKGGGASIAITIGIILIGMIITAIFKDYIFGAGEWLMGNVGQGWVDVILFFLTGISSTPLTLPIWGYALVGVAMGYQVLRLALVMALGSATGSTVTFLLGRYSGRSNWVKRKFPNLQDHPWTVGKSRFVVTLLLFVGTASPIPCDVFYAACGLKRYPPVLFWFTMVAGRFVRYCYLGYGFNLFQRFM